MKKEDVQKKLFVSVNTTYGDKYIEHLLEQYKIYVTAAEKISDRRQKTNEFFLALNAALVTLLGFVTAKATPDQVVHMLGFAAVAGIVMCYLWYRIIRSYKGLNSGKFEVIHSIEERLPLALYDTEWEVVGRGKNKEIYWPFSHIELIVPQVFIVIYSFFIVSLVPGSFVKASAFYFLYLIRIIYWGF